MSKRNNISCSTLCICLTYVISFTFIIILYFLFIKEGYDVTTVSDSTKILSADSNGNITVLPNLLNDLQNQVDDCGKRQVNIQKQIDDINDQINGLNNDIKKIQDEIQPDSIHFSGTIKKFVDTESMFSEECLQVDVPRIERMLKAINRY